MSTPGRTRSNLNILSKPSRFSALVGALGPDIAVEISAEEGDWCLVKAAGLRGAIEGYAPKNAIARPPVEMPPVFPQIGQPPIELVPAHLTASQVVAWLQAGGKPDWVDPAFWQTLEEPFQQATIVGLQQAIIQRQSAWDAWLADLQANKRLEQATLAEWLIILAGGQDMWSIRAERIYTKPSLTGGYLGWVGVDDILHWTGRIARDALPTSSRLYHQVGLYKLGKYLEGWYRSELLDDYIFPTPENDPAVAANAARVFDLAKPVLRPPADPEIAQTLAQGSSAAQYIDIQAVIGRKKKHYNLCGEFCVAALAGENVIPLLQRWITSYPRAKTILENNRGTTIADLQSILRLVNLRGEMFQYSSSVAPTSPARVKDILRTGKRAIAGVVINSRGKLDAKGTIQHWVVIVDTLAVGTGGWIRVYNPFKNQEEVYTFDLFLQALRLFGIGLWVEAL